MLIVPVPSLMRLVASISVQMNIRHEGMFPAGSPHDPLIVAAQVRRTRWARPEGPALFPSRNIAPRAVAFRRVEHCFQRRHCVNDPCVIDLELTYPERGSRKRIEIGADVVGL